MKTMKKTNEQLPAIRRADGQHRNHLRKFKSTTLKEVRVSPNCIRLVADMTKDLKFGRDRAKDIHDAEQLITNLMLARSIGRVLRISRSTSVPGGRRLVRVVDTLDAAGLVLQKPGSQLSGMLTLVDFTVTARKVVERYQRLDPTIVDDFVEMQNKKLPSPLELELSPIVLRDADKRAKPFKWTKQLRAHGDRLTQISQRNLDHHYVFERVIEGRRFRFQPIISVRSIFNGDFQHGGRLYSFTCNGYSSLKKHERRTMLIDGEPICEFDYSGFHPRLLYHLSGVEAPKDVYQVNVIVPGVEDIHGALRTAIKKFTNTCLNATSIGKATSSASLWLLNHSKVADLLNTVGIRPKVLIERIIESHPTLQPHFFTGCGLKIQATHEVPLMLDLLEAIQRHGAPALSLHDAVITRESDAKIARHAMRLCYSKRFGFEPQIKRAFQNRNPP